VLILALNFACHKDLDSQSYKLPDTQSPLQEIQQNYSNKLYMSVYILNNNKRSKFTWTEYDNIVFPEHV